MGVGGGEEEGSCRPNPDFEISGPHRAGYLFCTRAPCSSGSYLSEEFEQGLSVVVGVAAILGCLGSL